MKNVKIILITSLVAVLWGCAPSPEAIGESYFETRQYPQAIENFKKAHDENPKNAEYILKIARAYFFSFKYSEAIEWYKKSIELSPRKGISKLDLAYLGRSYYENKQYYEGIQVLSQINSVMNNGLERTMLIDMFKKTGQYDSAIEILKKEINADARNVQNFEDLSLFYNMNHQYDEAITAAKRLIELDPNSSPGYLNLGYAYRQKKLYNQAISSYNQAVQIFPFDVDASLPLSRIYQEIGEMQKAYEILLKIRGLDPENYDINYELAQLLYIMGRYSNSIEILNKSIERKKLSTKNMASLYALRSLNYRKLGSLQQAQLDAEKANELNPDEVALVMGASALDRNEYDVAMKYLSCAKEGLYPRLLEAIVYTKRGDTEKAIQIYKNIIVQEIRGQNVPFEEDRQKLLALLNTTKNEFRNKAEQYEKAGQVQNALSAYAEAMLLSPDEKETKTIRTAIFKLAGKFPSQSEIPVEAYQHIVRGEMLIQEIDYENAVIEFKKALNLAPFSSRLYFNIALIEAKLEHYAQAIRYMNIYLEVASDAPNARAAKNEIIKWEMLIEKAIKP